MTEEQEKAVAKIDRELTRLTDMLYSGSSISPRHKRRLRRDIDELLDKRTAIQRGEARVNKTEIPQLTGVTYGDGRNRTL